MEDDSIIIKCMSCGAKNRIPRQKQYQNPLCGKCHRPIFRGSANIRPVDVTDLTFNDEVMNNPGIVLVDFWAPWCAPCRMMAPIIEQLATEYAGRVKIAKMNVDENPMTAALYSISSIPTLIIFKGGRHLHTMVGATTKLEIQQHISAHM
ncbi:MAG TPA: thioredoxin [Deltaproteobacteria bacterium]|nr:thioredoxin [Deltaproteobacteria bacterium]